MSNALVSFGLTLLIVVSFMFGITYYPIIVAKIALTIFALGIFGILWVMINDLVKDWREAR